MPLQSVDTAGDLRTMPLVVDGVSYYTASEIAGRFSVSRQTLWRWRSSGKIPYGQRFRDHQVVFSEPEVKAIEQYANRIEPVRTFNPQLSLFASNRRQQV